MFRHVLPVNRTEWKQIKNNSNCNDITQDAAKRAYVASLDKASRELSKNWDDSYEKILQRQEENKAKQKQDEYESKMKFFKELMEQKKKEREEILADARDTFFKQKDEPKVLLSALMCSEMLREQQAQRDFNMKLKEESKKRDLEYVKFLDEKWDEWHKDQIKKRQQNKEKNIAASLILKERAETERLRINNEKKDKLKWEKTNREKALLELKALEEQELEQKKRNQEIFVENVNMVLEAKENRRKEEEMLREKESMLIKIYENTQIKIQKMRKIREKEIEYSKTKCRSKVRKLFEDKTAERNKIEHERYLKAKEENLKKEKLLIEQEHEHLIKMKEERKKSHEEWLKVKAQKLKDKEKQLIEEMENRTENIKHTQALVRKVRGENIKKITEIKSFNLNQQKEHYERKAKEKADLLKFFGDDRIIDMEAADTKFFEFADQLIAECEAVGRPTGPLHKVVKDYKLRYLQPQKRLPHQLKTHFPFATDTNEKDNSVENKIECKCDKTNNCSCFNEKHKDADT